MRRAVFAVPGSLETPTGGYAYDRRMVAELRAQGWRIEVLDLGEGFPFPDVATRDKAIQALNGIASKHIVVIDGLAFGVLPQAAAQLSRRCPVVALVHHPLALETGLDAAQMQSLRASETAALRHARAVIVTSHPTAALVAAQFAVDAAMINVVTPGVDRILPAARQNSAPHAVQLLAVGSVIARKGHDRLVKALSALQALPWRLSIAGDLTRDPACAAQLRRTIADAGLKDRVRLLGAVPEARLRPLYAQAELFVLASYFEGYGMVFSEAIAAGLPVIATDVGGAAEIAGDAGIVVPAHDVDALRDALGRAIASAPLRQAFASAARQRAENLPQWSAAGRAFAAVLERLA